MFLLFFFQAEDGIRDLTVTGVQTCALPISPPCFAPHWIRPTLVWSSTNAVITSCEVLRLACRSSFTRYAIWKPALRVGGKSVSRESCICVWRLSTYGTHVVWPASRRQTVFSACE